MKLPRGFGKNYFSLNAITATVNGVMLHASATRVHHSHMQGVAYAKEDETTAELQEEEAPCLELFVNPQGCHCSCFFLSQTRKILKLFFKQQKLVAYYITLNNAISPPYSLRNKK